MQRRKSFELNSHVMFFIKIGYNSADNVFFKFKESRRDCRYPQRKKSYFKDSQAMFLLKVSWPSISTETTYDCRNYLQEFQEDPKKEKKVLSPFIPFHHKIHSASNTYAC
ncbi:hypothetical protein AVEN_203910-1 [Araneus ventricosus]|uniref:Uncharacterized protein n=1 Tax=Araneus ventricosus TaxID=182803 RepID=A0A4Y2V2K7_ARAVE|nr:hypothetical protein AVEN_110865-1 [Araneus ventricosus]GBO17990.1 hypothetical protein AVEN_203910-1 [Araneus ventricosus]